jgi:uncharacterized membrane protein (UPF0136 family)
MLDKIITLLIIGVVLYIIYVIAGMLVSALSLPGIILTLIGVILLLVFVVKILRIFGITL